MTIPNSVTSIGDWAFYECRGLTSIEIPNSVTSIGEAAFAYCSGLTSVTIGNSVTSIGEAAFFGCTNLTTPVYTSHVFAYFPPSYSGTYIIPDGVESIAGGAFSGCTGLTNVTIPNSVTSIGSEAFNGCSGLTSVHINDIASWCNIEFGSNPLLYAHHLYLNDTEIKDLIIPNGITSIGHRAFYGCSGLTNVTIPNSVTSIGHSAFSGCTGLTNVTIPNSVTSIGNSAFSGCTGLTSIEIPNSVTSIGNWAFNNCSGLTNVTIGNGVTSIGNYAFSGCSGLTNVTIGNGVTSIGDRAFSDCSGLTNVIWNAENCNNSDYSSFFGSQVESFTFGNEVKTIPSYCCSNMNRLTKIIIPNSVTYIGYSAFYNCSGLTGTLSIPNNVTSIGNSAFYKCSGLTGTLNIPNSVTSIGNDAFYGCSSLTSVTIPNSITSIGNSAFSGCSGLSKVRWNMKNCSDFTSTPFSSALQNMSEFIIGDDVEHVPAYLCNGMVNLTTLSIGKSVKSIGNYAFAGLTNRKINELVLPNGLETIGDYAFSGDSYIEAIHFGSSLESIGSNAFNGCTRVTTMTCLSDVTPNVATNGLESINSNAILYVLNSCLQKYKVDTNWNRFVIEPLGTSDVLDPENGVTIEAGDNSATFIWPTNGSAELYKLVITKGGETVCTLLFNGSGQLAGISFAPSHDGQSHAPAATMTAAGMQFTVTGLSYATYYNYSLSVKDGSSNVLASYSGTFGTTGADEAQGLDQTTNDERLTTNKVLRNGQVLILRGDKTYTVTGQEVR